MGFFPWLRRQLTCFSRRLESSGPSSSIITKFQSSLIVAQVDLPD
jgi:hypothetical protein